MNKQYHLGSNPDGSKQWQALDSTREVYYCGSHYCGSRKDRTPSELKEMAESLLNDLKSDHPEVFLGITRKQYEQYRKQVTLVSIYRERYRLSFIDGSFSCEAPSIHSAHQLGVKWWFKQQAEAKVEELTLEQTCKELGRVVKIVK